ncbi:hypothetical protein ALP39_04868 [Pseudomonas marginalis pv. marginalis]|nr:hypothetical protein ALP39_04868 [Pseudomonas marginalis pv. marginalis]
MLDKDLDLRAPAEQFRARIKRRVPHQQRRNELRRTQRHQPVIAPHATGVVLGQAVPGPFALERRVIVKRIEGTVGFAMRAVVTDLMRLVAAIADQALQHIFAVRMLHGQAPENTRCGCFLLPTSAHCSGPTGTARREWASDHHDGVDGDQGIARQGAGTGGGARRVWLGEVLLHHSVEGRELAQVRDEGGDLDHVRQGAACGLGHLLQIVQGLTQLAFEVLGQHLVVQRRDRGLCGQVDGLPVTDLDPLGIRAQGQRRLVGEDHVFFAQERLGDGLELSVGLHGDVPCEVGGGLVQISNLFDGQAGKRLVAATRRGEMLIVELQRRQVRRHGDPQCRVAAQPGDGRRGLNAVATEGSEPDKALVLRVLAEYRGAVGDKSAQARPLVDDRAGPQARRALQTVHGDRQVQLVGQRITGQGRVFIAGRDDQAPGFRLDENVFVHRAQVRCVVHVALWVHRQHRATQRPHTDLGHAATLGELVSPGPGRVDHDRRLQPLAVRGVQGPVTVAVFAAQYFGFALDHTAASPQAAEVGAMNAVHIQIERAGLIDAGAPGAFGQVGHQFEHLFVVEEFRRGHLPEYGGKPGCQLVHSRRLRHDQRTPWRPQRVFGQAFGRVLEKASGSAGQRADLLVAVAFHRDRRRAAGGVIGQLLLLLQQANAAVGRQLIRRRNASDATAHHNEIVTSGHGRLPSAIATALLSRV